VGWWKLRSRREFLVSVRGYHDIMTDEIHIGRCTVPGTIFDDLPATIQGRGMLLKTHPVSFLDHEIPGIGHGLYEWFEPESTGELVGELLSSWRGSVDDKASKSEEDD
jgi:hypothetical protein